MILKASLTQPTLYSRTFSMMASGTWNYEQFHEQCPQPTPPEKNTSTQF